MHYATNKDLLEGSEVDGQQLIMGTQERQNNSTSQF